jgi:glycerol-3-phosphate acyltransferase PlsX
VTGAIQAVKSLGVKVILVGQQDVIKRELAHHDGDYDRSLLEIRHASEQITMEDSAGKALRQKKDSSLHVGSRMVRDGEAHGFVSAGNTGAVMAVSKMILGMIRGVDRPALASVFPTLKEKHPTVLVDVGANVDCDPRMLVQFAVMGEIYSRVILKQPKPRVGILSIGEEDHKGNELTKSAGPQIKAIMPQNFIGNVEGRDLFTGHADVIVCDGFIGNVALKVSEGLVDVIKHMLHDALEATITRKIGYVLSKAAYADFRKRVDYSEFGGAPLLGVKGVSIICHGRSNANAIKNAIRVGKEWAGGNINQQIEHELARWTSSVTV